MMDTNINKINLLVKTIYGFFPQFGQWFKNIKDPRMVKKNTYHLSLMIWIGITMFILKLKSSRNINFRLKKNFILNFKNIFPILGIIQNPDEIDRIPDYGTIIDLLVKLDEKKMEKTPRKMLRKLIKSRVLEKYRLFGKFYLIAIDGTRFLKFEERHCEHCLRREIKKDKNGNPVYEYYHYVLSAKLITDSGLALTIMTEFVENESMDVEKQDCELKAYYRLAKKLKAEFKKLNICLLLDSLYPNQNVFNICKENRWQYLIYFKEGAIPTAYQEYLEEKQQNPKNHLTDKVNKWITREYYWVNDIEWENFKLNVLYCKEDNIRKKKKKPHPFVWISSFPINKNKCHSLANQGGRLRSKIENQGFNSQKNEGYNLEHAYSKNYNAIKCFYHLMQIAHIINQLMQHGAEVKQIIKESGSLENFYLELWEDFRNQDVDKNFIHHIMHNCFQIRLDSS